MKHLLKDTSLWREGAYVGGEWLNETPHGRYPLRNPANGDVLVELPRCQQAEAVHAIEVAHRTHLDWRKTTAKHRSEVLRRWYELIVQNREDLATLITLEEGKPLRIRPRAVLLGHRERSRAPGRAHGGGVRRECGRRREAGESAAAAAADRERVGELLARELRREFVRVRDGQRHERHRQDDDPVREHHGDDAAVHDDTAARKSHFRDRRRQLQLIEQARHTT
ncbi:aldehyde dehydrogenase family protein [Burkholderia contaminans]|nr:aldehyde dehydrogenase family protein [Burkholderia contaminans]